MTVKVGINGFGAVGRRVYRIARHNPNIEIVAANGHSDVATMVHLLKYDSTYGPFDGEIKVNGNTIDVEGRKLKLTAYPNPNDIPWKEMGVEIVIDATGCFRSKEAVKPHMERGGARKVIITAPAKEEDITIVMGVNDELYIPEKHHVISCASCTTTCLAPVARVLHEEFGIVKALLTTVHAYTGDQCLLDKTHKDLRRARAAALSIIPTTTGAAKAVGLVLPELEGKMNGFALRVPVPTVSVVDLTAELGRNTSAKEVNAAFKEASEAGPLQGYLGYTEEPLVSADYKGSEYSGVVDAQSTTVIDNIAKVVAWYDNEWGYSARVVDLTELVAKHL